MKTRVSKNEPPPEFHGQSLARRRGTPMPAGRFLAVVKALQSISSERLLPQLQKTLMQVVLENAGAQRGFLLLAYGEQLSIHVQAEVRDKAIHLELVSATPPSATLLSLGVLNYVRRTGKPLVLADAAADHTTTDAYIARQRPRSVLCLPIMRQADLLGLLYLENNLVAGAFTTQALTVLELLATQAAIALENAKRYAALEQAITELQASYERYRRIVDTAGVGICAMGAGQPWGI